MRSKKPDLEDVKAEFAAWRRERRGRAIPEKLWKSALRLLDRYSSSTICAALGLNATRFKRVREAGSKNANGSRGRRRDHRGGVVRARGTSPESVLSMPPAFIELPSLSVSSRRVMAGPLREEERAGAGCRLTLEGAFGRLSVVTLGSPDAGGFVEAVCRWALSAPLDRGRDGGRS